MRNRKKYIKVAFKSRSPLLTKSVSVLQNLPGHCVATIRQGTHGIDIERVRNRALYRWEEIGRVNEAAKLRKTKPQFPPQRDLDSALSIAENVYLWLSQWDAKVTDHSIDRVYQDPVFVSYHEVTQNERSAPDLPEEAVRDSSETAFGADNSHNEDWN